MQYTGKDDKMAKFPNMGKNAGQETDENLTREQGDQGFSGKVGTEEDPFTQIQAGGARGGTTAQQNLHEGQYNDRDMSAPDEFVEGYIKDIKSDNPKERQSAGGALGGHIAQMKLHGQADKAEALKKRVEEAKEEAEGGSNK